MDIAPQQPIKHTKSLVITIVAVLVTAGVVGGLVYWYLTQGFNTEKASLEGRVNDLQLQVQKLQVDSSSATPEPTFTETEALALLPSDLQKYTIQKNGLNSDSSLYSVNVYFPDTAGFPTVNPDNIDTNNKTNQFIGSWVVRASTKKATRIAGGDTVNSNFLAWVSASQIELQSDSQDSASIYNAITGSVVSSRILKLNLAFSKSTGLPFTFKPVNQADASCTVTDTEAQYNVAYYPLSCVQSSDISMIIPGYSTMTLKYISPTSVSIDGKVYDNLLDSTGTTQQIKL